MKSENIITLHRGEVLYHQGDYRSTMFELIQGQVNIVVEYGKESERCIATLEPGRCFGVSGVLECYPRIATAVAAQEETVVKEITAEDFAGYFLENQDKVYDIMRHMGALLLQMDSDYARLSRAEAENRLEEIPRPDPVRAALLRLAAEWDAICDAMARAGAMDMAGKIR